MKCMHSSTGECTSKSTTIYIKNLLCLVGIIIVMVYIDIFISSVDFIRVYLPTSILFHCAERVMLRDTVTSSGAPANRCMYLLTYTYYISALSQHPEARASRVIAIVIDTHDCSLS